MLVCASQQGQRLEDWQGGCARADCNGLLIVVQEENEGKRTTLRHVLGLSEEEAVEIAATASVDSPAKRSIAADDDDNFF